jgi:predicted ATPase with chaperone activity
MATAILILIAEHEIHYAEQINDFLFFGELGLDGEVKRVNGLLPSVISAMKQ